jgi:hypothetical protein
MERTEERSRLEGQPQGRAATREGAGDGMVRELMAPLAASAYRSAPAVGVLHCSSGGGNLKTGGEGAAKGWRS